MYNHDHNGTVDSTFFKQLDQTMGAKLRPTITRPNTTAVLASLPAVTVTPSSSLTTTTTESSSTDDPIDELDAIIGDEDTGTIFHDPLDDLFDDNDLDNEMLEVINPNLKLPRPQLDSQPTGLFSVRIFFFFLYLSIISSSFVYSFSVDINKMLVILKTKYLIL
jgi:hypothetical protein